jgi:hypothetical protein
LGAARSTDSIPQGMIGGLDVRGFLPAISIELDPHLARPRSHRRRPKNHLANTDRLRRSNPTQLRTVRKWNVPPSGARTSTDSSPQLRRSNPKQLRTVRKWNVPPSGARTSTDSSPQLRRSNPKQLRTVRKWNVPPSGARSSTARSSFLTTLARSACDRRRDVGSTPHPLRFSV